VPETNTIILTVNKSGEFYISDENLSETQQVNREDLANAIMTWRGKSPAAVVVVKGDRDVDYGSVADVMDALALTKTLRFNLMTDLKKKEAEKK